MRKRSILDWDMSLCERLWGPGVHFKSTPIGDDWKGTIKSPDKSFQFEFNGVEQLHFRLVVEILKKEFPGTIESWLKQPEHDPHWHPPKKQEYDSRTCPKCSTQMEHYVDTEHSSVPEEGWLCPKCGYKY